MVYIAIGLVILILVLMGTRILVLKPPRWMQRVVQKPMPTVLFNVETDAKAVALTIDDAPSPEVTPGILDVLLRHDAQATFFVIGSRAERHHELLQTILDGGHELGNHLYYDRPSNKLDDEEFVAMLRRTEKLIQPAGPHKWCRPGSGWIDDDMVELLHQDGYRACLASVYPLDLVAPRWLTEWQFVSNAKPGAILVLHDGGAAREGTITTLEAVLPQLRERGYRVVTVSELVALGH